MTEISSVHKCHFQIKMPSFFKNFKGKGSQTINSETAVCTNRPFYLSPEHLSRETGPQPPDDNNGNLQLSNTAATTNELPILEPYSDPKDLISTIGSDSEPYRSEDDQNYMVPFSENGDYSTNNNDNQTLSSINTTTVLHNKQRDSLTEHLENGFNGEVYENIPTDIAASDPSNNIVGSVNVSSSIVDDSYYETTWGTLTGSCVAPVQTQKSYDVRSTTADCYENYNNNNRQYARGHSMYENADMLSSVNQIPSSNRFVTNEVFTADDFVSSASASQIPVNDSRPDAEYDVPWTSAAVAASAAQAQTATPQKAAPVEPESSSNFHRRGPLRSSNSTDEFSGGAGGRRRHKSGDFGNKKVLAASSKGQSNIQSSVTASATYQKPNDAQTKTMDLRPEDDYDQPWELTADKRSGMAPPPHRGNASPLTVPPPPNELLPKAVLHFTDPTNDLRPEDDYDQPWNLTSKQSKVPGASASNNNSGMDANSGSHQNVFGSQPILPPANVTASLEERSIHSAGSNHGLNKQQQGRSSVKVKNSASAALSANQSGNNELVDSNLSLEEQTWYHGQISRLAAEARLRPAPECSFLVRRSESSRHDFSLSIKSSMTIMHMKIQYQESTRKYILGQFSKPYVSIPAMISYYSKHTLNIKGAENVTLLHPVADVENML